MKRIPAPKLVVSAFIAAVLIFGCGGSDTVYSPEKDLKALARIQKTWTADIGGKTFTISLCEDEEMNAASSEWERGCSIEHVVRSRNPEEEWSPDHGSGCDAGGCQFLVVTAITAEVTNARGETLRADGEVRLGTGYNDNPYGGVYNVYLGDGELRGGHEEDGALSGSLRITENGSLSIGTDLLASLGYGALNEDVTARSVGEAQCGSPSDETEQGD